MNVNLLANTCLGFEKPRNEKFWKIKSLNFLWLLWNLYTLRKQDFWCHHVIPECQIKIYDMYNSAILYTIHTYLNDMWHMLEARNFIRLLGWASACIKGRFFSDGAGKNFQFVKMTFIWTKNCSWTFISCTCH
jgi:hypothetical protein